MQIICRVMWLVNGGWCTLPSVACTRYAFPLRLKEASVIVLQWKWTEKCNISELKLFFPCDLTTAKTCWDKSWSVWEDLHIKWNGKSTLPVPEERYKNVSGPQQLLRTWEDEDKDVCLCFSCHSIHVFFLHKGSESFLLSTRCELSDCTELKLCQPLQNHTTATTSLFEKEENMFFFNDWTLSAFFFPHQKHVVKCYYKWGRYTQ